MQLNCCSLRCSWSIACRRCSNYIFILHWTLDFNILDKDNSKSRWETLKFRDLVPLILATLQYIWHFAEYEYIDEADMDDIRGSLPGIRERQESINRITNTEASDKRVYNEGTAMDTDEEPGSTGEENHESQESDGDEWSEGEVSMSRKTSGVPDNLPDMSGIKLGEHQRSTRRKASDGYEIPSTIVTQRENEADVYIIPLSADSAQTTS